MTTPEMRARPLDGRSHPARVSGRSPSAPAERLAAALAKAEVASQDLQGSADHRGRDGGGCALRHRQRLPGRQTPGSPPAPEPVALRRQFVQLSGNHPGDTNGAHGNSDRLVAAALGTLAGCDTTSAVAPYSASTPNVLAFQTALKQGGNSVNVGEFTQAATITKPSCRLMGDLDPTAGKSYAEYIKQAMQTELFAAQVYDVNAHVVIRGTVDDIKVSTFGTGSWTLGLQVTSTVDPTGYHVEVTHKFATSFSALSACRNATDAFAPTVQELLSQVVNNPEFAKLTAKG